MWLMLVGRILAWHFTICSGDNESCALQRNEKPQILYASPKHTLSLNSGIFDMKEEAEALKAFFLFAGIVRRKLLCVCPLVAQSRCPNQIPQHFLLSTATAQNFHCEKVKGQEPSFMWLVPHGLKWCFEKGTSIKSQTLSLHSNHFSNWGKNSNIVCASLKLLPPVLIVYVYVASVLLYLHVFLHYSCWAVNTDCVKARLHHLDHSHIGQNDSALQHEALWAILNFTSILTGTHSRWRRPRRDEKSCQGDCTTKKKNSLHSNISLRVAGSAVTSLNHKVFSQVALEEWFRSLSF